MHCGGGRYSAFRVDVPLPGEDGAATGVPSSPFADCLGGFWRVWGDLVVSGR